MAQLVYTDPESGQQVTVDVGEQLSEVTIGRNPGNTVRVNNPSISRQHAKVIYENGQCTLVDLDSSNGSYINGNRIRSQVLVDGDRIRVGEFPVDFRGATDGATAEVDQEIIDSVLRSAAGNSATGDFRRQTALGGFEADNDVAEQSGPVGQAQMGPFGQWNQQPRGTMQGTPLSAEPDDAFAFVEAKPEGDSGPMTLPDDAIMSVDPDESAEMIGDDEIMDEIELDLEPDPSEVDNPAQEVARGLRDLDRSGGNDNQTVEQDVGHLIGMAGGSLKSAGSPGSAPNGAAAASAAADPDLLARIAELESERDELLDLLQNRAGDAQGASQVQIDRLRNERDRLIEERRNLKRQITDLQADLEKAPDLTTFEQTQVDLEEAQAQVVELEDEVNSQREQLQSRQEEVETLESRLEAGEAELAQAQAEAAEAEALRDELEQLRASLSESANEMQQTADQVSAYESDFASAQQEIQQLVDELEQKNNHATELEADLHDLRNAFSELEAEFDQQAQQLAEAAERADSADERSALLQSELDARPVSEEVDALVKDLAQTRASLESMTSERDELASKRDELEARVAEQQKSVDEATERHDAMQKKLATVTEERDELKAEKGAFARETDYLQSERRKHDSELRDLRKKVKKLEKDDKRKKQVFAELSGDLKKLVKENTALQARNEELRNQLEAAPSDGDLSELKGELDELQKKVAGLEKETDDLTRELGGASDAKEKAQAELEAAHEKLAEAEKAAERVAELEGQLAELEGQLEEARAASEDGDQVEKLTKKLAEAEDTLAAVILERDKLEDQLKKK